MRLAALYDIHGNLPALEAVLETIEGYSLDLIVAGGDVLPGPMVNECMQALESTSIPVRFLAGNGDRTTLAYRSGQTLAEVPAKYQDGMRWVSQHLNESYAHVIAQWPKTLDLKVDDLAFSIARAKRTALCVRCPFDRSQGGVTSRNAQRAAAPADS